MYFNCAHVVAHFDSSFLFITGVRIHTFNPLYGNTNNLFIIHLLKDILAILAFGSCEKASINILMEIFMGNKFSNQLGKFLVVQLLNCMVGLC